MDGDVEAKQEKKAWRGSLLMDFGHEVGETLTELELEYDEMIVNFEQQKSRLKAFAPQEDTIQEETTRAASPAHSDASSSGGVGAGGPHTGKRASSGSTGGLKSSFRTIKRRLSNRGSSSSQRTSPRMVKREQQRSIEDLRRHDRSETSSVNSEVFASAEQAANGVGETKDSMDYPLPMAYDQHRDSASSAGSSGSRLSAVLSGKPPISPGKVAMRFRSSTVSLHEDHVITPPVVIDGEVKRDYQYVSPARRVGGAAKNESKGIFRSSSFAKILGRAENGSPGRSRHSSKEESPLKALYKATVLGEANDKENRNNHNNNAAVAAAAMLRVYKCTT